jgi:hypothetical protein
MDALQSMGYEGVWYPVLREVHGRIADQGAVLVFRPVEQDHVLVQVRVP